MNLVIDVVLDGGVNDAPNLDAHGKALAFPVLGLTVRVAAALVPPGYPVAGSPSRPE